ncbi:MAG: proline--tRNA ligase [Gammaproteobacteria bacterium]|nr:MAG: proline--tRNA ligase [Gammaproteobacteria bacterium]
MRLSHYFLPTSKETPAEAEVVSHQLMLRAGMIRQTSAGIYTWLPLGMRVYKKVEAIVRQEMNAIGALEIDMPSAQPAELWQASGRWQDYGPELLRFKDRGERDFCIGPTHEEVVTDLLKGLVTSYKQLPLTLYQIQKKFRDEVRPRFGVMRGREFLMKDAYSFHADLDSLQATYDDMDGAYHRIFERIGLAFRAVAADSGSIGGSNSHEFHVLAETGEDFIAFSDSGDYAANVELAQCVAPESVCFPDSETMVKMHTPNCKTIDAVCAFLKTDSKQSIKTLVVEGEDGELVGLCLRGDHTLNALKVEKLPGIAAPLVMADPEKIKKVLGCEIGSIGPVDFNGRLIVDHACFAEQSLVCGANDDNYHFVGMNWARDVGDDLHVADIRNIEAGDPSPDGRGSIVIRKGIEVGHIFQLGNKYSAAMNLTVLDKAGRSIVPEMGCYGIGVTRIVAAAIEQNHDKWGIIWPDSIAPFTVAIAPIHYGKSEQVSQVADELYQSLQEKGVDVCLDDRGKRPGVMFSELELIGIPHRIVIGDKTLADGEVEYKGRRDEHSQRVGVEDTVNYILQKLS